MQFSIVISPSATSPWDGFKLMCINLFTWIFAIFSPLQSVLLILFVAFIMNIFGGVLTMSMKDEEFSLKKFSEAFLQLLLFGSSIVFVHWLGNTFHDNLLQENGVKWLTYVIIWGYAVNIFKNAKIKWPENKGIAIIYSVLIVEVIKTIKSQFDKK